MSIPCSHSGKHAVSSTLCPAGGAVLVAPARGGAALHPAALNVVVVLIRLGAAPCAAVLTATLGVHLVLVRKGNNARSWWNVLSETTFSVNEYLVKYANHRIPSPSSGFRWFTVSVNVV